MGLRSSASKQLEKAFAAAFATYFVNDDTFAKEEGPIFTAAQATTDVLYPLVTFKCEAQQVGRGCPSYQGHLTIDVKTDPEEVYDDSSTVDELHDSRCAAISALLDLPSALQTLINKPASGPDIRTVKNITVFGYTPAQREATDQSVPNRLHTIIELFVGFQAMDNP